MTTMDKANAVAADPEARAAWIIVVVAVAFLVMVGWGFRPR